MRGFHLLLALLLFPFPARPADADLIIHNAKVVTVDTVFRIAQAVAVEGGRIRAVGSDLEILKLKGASTRVIDAKGKSLLPGLYDSHVHPLGAAMSEWKLPLPELKSLAEVFAFIRKKTETTPEGDWIVIRYAFPTRLEEARFPTKAELDAAAPKHPVLYHAGPAGVVNSMGLKVSGVTRQTKDPANGVIVRGPDGEATGMLRNAYGVLKGVPGDSDNATKEDKLAALKKLFKAYNELGLTSVADRNAGREALDLYFELQAKKELTVRLNVARQFNAGGSRGEIAARLDALPGTDKRGGPTGVGDAQIRIGPIKLFLDGGMLNGTAYMRQPWPKGPAYQVTQDDYRGLLFIPPEQLNVIVEEAVKRGWQVTAHTAGEAAMDHLLDAYEFADRSTPVKELRLCITHANFPSKRNLERCQKLGVCADVQPAWLYKDGTTLLNVLGAERLRWFQPYRSWMEHTTIGGGSDHMLRFDSIASTNPWNPWLGMAVALDRITERGTELVPEEKLTREQAIRLYTINNAYLHREESIKGSLEAGKLADMVLVDRDPLTCSPKDLRAAKALLTVVGGNIVHEAR